MQRKMQEMLKRRIFRLSDIEYGVYVVYTGCCTLEALYTGGVLMVA